MARESRGGQDHHHHRDHHRRHRLHLTLPYTFPAKTSDQEAGSPQSFLIGEGPHRQQRRSSFHYAWCAQAFLQTSTRRPGGDGLAPAPKRSAGLGPRRTDGRYQNPLLPLHGNIRHRWERLRGKVSKHHAAPLSADPSRHRCRHPAVQVGDQFEKEATR